jgi:iron complex transport system substrate-binding protein
MGKSKKRIVSLLPGTTEIVAGLGLEKLLVGRSHECDFPASVQSLPACTEPKFNPDGQSYEIDQRVKALLQEGLSVYRVNAQQLAELEPDVIITQDHCEVCATSVDEVKKATAEYLDASVEILSVSPTNLDQVYASITQIAEILGEVEAGKDLIQNMRDGFNAVKKTVDKFDPKKLLCIEWLDPLMTAGNWVPELVHIAGGQALAAEAGAHSPWVDWSEIMALNPDAICMMPCGYSINQTKAEMDTLTSKKGWEGLKAVQNNQVYIADGHHYFNRPGPRLVDSARILAEISYPSLKPSFQHNGWITFCDEKD